MTSYSNFTDQELIEILSKQKILSFIAKQELKKEFLNRKVKGQNILLESLDSEIAIENQKIEDLKYLNHLGLKIVRKSENAFEIRRSGKGILIDILAIVFGFVLFLIGLIGLGNVSSIFSSGEKLNIISFINGIALVFAGLYGVKMLINGASRLIEYIGFDFRFIDDHFSLKKPFDIDSKGIEGKISSLHVSEYENHSSLMHDNKEIIRVNAPNVLNIKTLQKIIDRNKGN